MTETPEVPPTFVSAVNRIAELEDENAALKGLLTEALRERVPVNNHDWIDRTLFALQISRAHYLAKQLGDMDASKSIEEDRARATQDV